MTSRRIVFGLLTAGAAVVLAANAEAQIRKATPKIGDPPEAGNMRLVGMSDLQARSQRQGDRYYAYIGHHGGTPQVPQPMNPLTGKPEYNGTSILDVTDPANVQYLAHIPGEMGFAEDGGAQMVRVCSGAELPKGNKSAFYMLRTFGNSAHEIWDVTNPGTPKLLVRLDGLKGTHKNWWECDTGIAYLVSGVDGWRVPRMTQIYDLSDPTKPVFIRNFGLPGQQPGTTGVVPTQLHGPISTGPKGNRVYFGYGTSAGGVIQIVDREKLLNGPKEPTNENLLYPQVGRLEMTPLVGAHTTYPLLGVPVPQYTRDTISPKRDFLMIVDESTANECQQARQLVWFADITVEDKPMVVSNYQAPEVDGDFCRRGGRFGSHSSNESFAPVYYGKLAFISYFNGGVRTIDIRNPMNPREVGFFIPSITDKTDSRCIKVDGKDQCKYAIQTNNVETDDRGYVYIVDRANTGLHVLEISGEAREIAGLPPLR
jgi:hypothetical protein